jgi:hypothetical protein
MIRRRLVEVSRWFSIDRRRWPLLSQAHFAGRSNPAGVNDRLSNLGIDPAISLPGLNSLEDYLRFDIEAASEVWGLRETFRWLEKIEFGGSRASL